MIITAFDIGSKNLAYTVASYHYNFVNVLFMNCIDIEQNSSNKHDWFKNLHYHLKTKKKLWEITDIILIEQQLGFKSIINYNAIQLASHIHAFFLLFYPSITIIHYPSYWKTKVLKIKTINKTHRKKWAIQFIRDYMKDDIIFISWLDLFVKQDDICDCVLMILVYGIQNKFIKY